MPNLPSITFDPATRAPQFIGAVVTANAVDPVTGINPGSVDQTTPLTFTYLNGGAANGNPAAATITEVAVASDGSRVLKIAPGVVSGTPPGGSAGQPWPWSIRISAAGRTGTLTVSGSTPAVQDVSGVSWNGVGPTTTQPTA